MSCTCGGRLFHTRGLAALKLRSPKLSCVRGTKHVLTAAERSKRRSVSVTSWISSAKYAGVWPDSDWCTRHATLESTRRRTGSQCNWRSTGVMWSHRWVSVTRRAAAFCVVIDNRGMQLLMQSCAVYAVKVLKLCQQKHDFQLQNYFVKIMRSHP